MVGLDILLGMESQAVLAFHLLGNSLPAVTLEVSPKLENVDRAATHELFITYI